MESPCPCHQWMVKAVVSLLVFLWCGVCHPACFWQHEGTWVGTDSSSTGAHTQNHVKDVTCFCRSEYGSVFMQSKWVKLFWLALRRSFYRTSISPLHTWVGALWAINTSHSCSSQQSLNQHLLLLNLQSCMHFLWMIVDVQYLVEIGFWNSGGVS